MTKSLATLSAVVLFSLSSFAAHNIEGTWKFPLSVTTPYTSFESVITFTRKLVTLKNTCSLNGHTIFAQVTVPFAYTKQNFDILSSAQSSQSANGVACAAVIESGIHDYAISKDGSILVVSIDRDHTLNLTRQ